MIPARLFRILTWSGALAVLLQLALAAAVAAATGGGDFPGRRI